jgi:uncharacterized membrane protein YfcA
MKMDVIERSAAVLVGMAAGYVLWLAGVTGLTVVVPMRYVIVAAAVLLAVILAIAFASARYFRKSGRRSVALGIAWAPALPVVASIYSLIVFLN